MLKLWTKATLVFFTLGTNKTFLPQDNVVFLLSRYSWFTVSLPFDVNSQKIEKGDNSRGATMAL